MNTLSPTFSRGKRNPFCLFIILPALWLLCGCATTHQQRETAAAGDLPVVEAWFSQDDTQLTLGIANIHNYVYPLQAWSIEWNKQRILQCIDTLKARGADMILFPEFCLAGYFWDDRGTGECLAYMRQGLTDRHMDWVREVKSKLDGQLRYIIFNNIRLNPADPSGLFYNSTYVIDGNFDTTDLDSPANERCHIYDKTFLPGIENCYTQSGETDSLILATKWGRFGFTTCYDMCFTELFQEYGMVDRVDALIQLASWRGTASRDYPGMKVKTDHYYGFIWDAMTTSQAAYNQYWILGCNAVGRQQVGDYDFWGGSGLWAPSGMRLYEASHDREELIVIHNIEIEKEVKSEHADFYYRDDFLKVYKELPAIRTFTRIK